MILNQKLNMIKLLFLCIPFIACSLFAQAKDSINTHTVFDSTRIAISDSSITSDSSAIGKYDSLKTKRDTLIVFFQKPFSDKSYFINRSAIDKMDYRYAGDLFKPFDFYYIKDFGYIGYPNESMIYGAGFNAVSYLQNGVMLNNRLSNSMDLNQIQTESIDSIEVIPSPRGFLYSSSNNPVSVNVIQRDFLTRLPYTRIKYYQGPNGEALVDGIFNSRVLSRLNIYFDFTNRKVDDYYSNFNYSTNNHFSMWQTNLKLKYFLTDKINLYAGYQFYRSVLGRNGGVDVDSIKKITSDVNTYLYDPINAPVYSQTREQKEKWHLLNFRLLGKLVDHTSTDFNLYYKFNQSELLNGDTSDTKYTNKNKTLGFLLRQNFNLSFFDLNFIANYEKMDLRTYSSTKTSLQSFLGADDVFSLSGSLSLHLLDSTFVPSAFIKYTNESTDKYVSKRRNNFQGFGFDVKYKFLKYAEFYFGYSNYQNAVSINNIQSWQTGIDAYYNGMKIGASLFKRENFIAPEYNGVNQNINYPANFSGLGLNFKLDTWKILIEGNGSFYKQGNTSDLFIEFPKTELHGGLYYKGLLFKDNLNLKTGFAFYYTGKMKTPVSVDPNGIIDPTYRIDFTLAGEIQKVAMVYFAWQNLLDRQYYLIPYYPMPGRSIRFGLSWELFN